VALGSVLAVLQGRFNDGKSLCQEGFLQTIL